MRYLGIAILMLFAISSGSAQAVKISTAYNYPLLPGTSADSVLNGTGSIRGCSFDADVDGDGKAEIVVSNYLDLGHAHVFEVVGNDSIALVWTSPRLTSGGGGSTPRIPIFGDLDNDGLKEVIFQSASNGILIFEWDGVTGSDNYGTLPSQVIGAPGFLTGAGGNCEYMEVSDVDGDGVNELTVAYNGSSNADDNYYVISAIGDWATNDAGFSSFNVEYIGRRTDLDGWGIGGGSPYAMIAANLDGAGNPEILIHNWNAFNLVPMTVPAADTYQISDSTGGNGNLQVSAPNDYVALFGGMAFDVDKDGRDEVYLPVYVGADPTGAIAGSVQMVSYDAGQSLSQIDASNVTSLDLTGVVNVLDNTKTFGATTTFGYGYGDIDADGKPNIYISTSYPYNVVDLEFQGGDKKNLANWTAEVLYPGETTIYTALTITDSLGTIDTAKTVQTAFASKMYAKYTDFDKDGYEDLILPYQALNDSVTITTLTWNSGSSQYDTLVTKEANPKRWGLRVLESTTLATGVEDKDLTVIMPDDYRLEQNYPNPFNPSTTISFFLPVKNQISVKIYDMLGKEIRTLIDNQDYPAGASRITWDGRNNAGQPASSGTYFYSLIYGNFKLTQKMMLLK